MTIIFLVLFLALGGIAVLLGREQRNLLLTDMETRKTNRRRMSVNNKVGYDALSSMRR